MVERGGFEPPKAEPADLQSAPFNHSGTSPSSLLHGASEGNRTPDPLITNQLLYHLSYAGKDSKNIEFINLILYLKFINISFILLWVIKPNG